MHLSRSSHNGILSRVRSIGTAWGALASLFFVLLTVFVYTSRIVQRNGDPEAGGADWRAEAADGELELSSGRGGVVEQPQAERDAEVGASAASLPASATVRNGAEPLQARDGTLPAAPASYLFEDADLGFRTRLPSGWQALSLDGSMAPLGSASHDWVLEDPATGARIALSAWDAGGLAPLHLWLPSVAPGMRSVDGQWPSNAFVAGEPAIALWAPESPTSPAQYAVFLAHSERYYRLAYAARDGGQAMGAFANALAGLDWLDSPAGASLAPITVPPLPLPAPRYFPGEGLFSER